MQIIISPAKLMDFSKESDKIKPTKPHFLDKTAQLVEVCRELSKKDIQSKMKINPNMARDVHEYYQTFDFKSTPRRAASLAYNGIAYKGLNAHDFTAEDFDFAQEHFNIISGLYGMLRPRDEIKPYRLEMNRKIAPKGYKTLYAFWEDSLNAYFSKKLRKDDKTIIHVASNEYGKILNSNKLPSGKRIIEMNFLQHKGSDLKQIIVHTKKARGLISRFIIKNKLTTVEDIKAFDYEDYFFYPKLSNDSQWFFVR